MHTPKALFKYVAKSLLNAAGGVLPIGDFLVDVLPSLAKDAMRAWSKETTEEQRRQEVQALTQSPAAEVRKAAAEVVQEVAANQPGAVRQALAAYLTQLPAAIRQSFRRPADATGVTVPPGLLLRKEDDLLPLLPRRLPRFNVGDRPLAGVDWELVELLGVGGFGEVWKARNSHMSSVAPVALKFCLDADTAKVLRHEASILDRVRSQGRHAGIVELRHSYLSADPPCLEYEYIAGGDLAGWIQDSQARGGQPPRQAARLIQEIAAIVGYAHRLNPPIVHRDLKPANILVHRSADGKVQFKIADFGLGGTAARQAIAQSTRKGVPPGRRLTTLVRGAHTPLYASPQQMLAQDPDPRDDVHALGVIWYQLLLGDLTVGAPSGLQWAQQLRQRGMTTPLIRLLASCLEARADDRPADAAVLAKQLAALLEPGGGKPALPPQTGKAGAASPRPKPAARTGSGAKVALWLLSVGALAAVALVGAALLSQSPSTETPPPPGPGVKAVLPALLPKDPPKKATEKIVVPPAPRYRGKTLAEWGEALKSADANVRQEAATAVAEAKGEAVAVLVAALAEGNADVRVTVAATLGQLGAAAKPALPSLLGALKDPNGSVRATVAEALWQVDRHPKGLLGLDEAAGAPEKKVSQQAKAALARIGAEAVPVLSKSLQTEGAERRPAALALGKLGKSALTALPALLGCLQDPDGPCREAAILAIGEICGKAQVWSPAVRKALDVRLEDAEPSVRQAVALTLGRAGDEAIGSLRVALKDAKAPVRREAARSVSWLSDRAAAAALPELLACCRSSDVEERKAAYAALVRLVGPEDVKQAREPLRQGLADKEVEIRRNAALALAAIGGRESAAAVPVLLDMLRQNTSDANMLNMRRHAALAIGTIGPDARDAVPELRKCLSDPDEEIRHNAAVSFIGLKQEGEPALLDLVRLLTNKGEVDRVRTQAAVAISRTGYGPRLMEVMPAILQVVGDRGEKSPVRERAMWALRPYLSNAKDLTPVYQILRGILGELRAKETKMLRYDAAYILGMVQAGDAPESALDVLLEYLMDPTIKIYAGRKAGVSGSTAGKWGKATGTEMGRDDGRYLAIDALTRIGAQRVARRPEIVAQLRALDADPTTRGEFSKSIKKLLADLQQAK